VPRVKDEVESFACSGEIDAVLKGDGEELLGDDEAADGSRGLEGPASAL
jgi:hypothetical protein